MYILGISGLQSVHDPAACLLKDGKIIAAVEEERLIREKHAVSKFPTNAIKFCLDYAKISISEVDYFAYGWSDPASDYLSAKQHYIKDGHFWRLPKYALKHLYLSRRLNKRDGLYFLNRDFNLKEESKIKYFDHHLSHAASAFRCSGFDKSMILTFDNKGEIAATTLGFGNDETISVKKRILFPDSLGLIYGAFTEYLGFTMGDGEGKVMGLAPYGKPVYDLNDFLTLEEGGYRLNAKYFCRTGHYSPYFIEKFGPKREIKNGSNEKAVPSPYPDIAASVQKKLEDSALHLLKILKKDWPSDNLCLAGGVALNCVMNGVIFRSGLIKDMFIQPLSNDAGTAIGAALELYHSLGYKSKFKLEHLYYGPEFTNEEIKVVLDKNKVKYEERKGLAGDVAELLAKDKIVAWFQGRMELGPRALGNRSILANPRNKEMSDIVNMKVKFREPWRPFCPSMLAEVAHKYLEDSYEAPFMIHAFYVREDKKSEIPAVTHVDGSARPQTVKKNINPKYYDLIKKFGKETGTPVVLNTSLNIKGEPIICTPQEAVDCFLKTGLDYLAIGDYLVSK